MNLLRWDLFYAKIFRVKQKNQNSAFTLVEIMIATTIFAMVVIMGSQVYTNITQMSRKIEIQEYVFSEAEAAVSRIVREVQRSTVDYEEYYSRNVLWDENYGQNYGAYGSVFYDPGTGGPLDDLVTLIEDSGDGKTGGDGIDGASCDADDEYFFTEDCTDFDTDTYDTSTGQHQYSGAADDYNAFCVDEGDCNQFEWGFHNELYLIDAAGEKKVIFVLENKDGDEENVISMVVLDGVDVDGDNISDYWECNEDYTCTVTVTHDDPDGVDVEYLVPDEGDLTNEDIDDDNFEPITPDSLNVTELSFFISPSEDPYRAFAEADQVTQQHPEVTVMMAIEPSAEVTSGLLGDEWSVIVQRNASAIVFDVVPSEYKGLWRWD